jgi:hypothetical protein
MTTEVDLKLLETMIRLKQEEDGITQVGRDPYAEAARDMRSYSSDPYSRHRLEGQRHEGVPVAGARVPRNVTFEQDEQGWWANKPAWGPFETLRDAEFAVLGKSELSGGKRDWRDGPPSE